MLLDTSGLFCLFNRADVHHAAAVDLYDRAPVCLMHNYVLAEFVALANARALPRGAALAFAGSFPTSPEIRFVWVDRSLHAEAVAFLQHRLDEAWSLCDAVSFLLMAREAITEALTTDVHFEQAGLVRLLKP